MADPQTTFQTYLPKIHSRLSDLQALAHVVSPPGMPPPPQAGWTFFTILQPKLNKIIESVSPHAWHIAGVPSRESCNALAEVVPTSPACLQGWLSTWPADLGTCPSQAGHRQMKLPVKKAILCRPHTGHLIHVPSVSPLLQDKGSTPPEPQGWVRQADGGRGAGFVHGLNSPPSTARRQKEAV